MLRCWTSSVQFSRSVMSDSLGPHRLQARLPWTREDCKAQPFPQVQAWAMDSRFCFVFFFLILTHIHFGILSRERFVWNSCSLTHSCPTLCHPMDCITPGFPVLHYLLEFAKLMSIEWVVLSNHLILCCPLLLLPSIFPSIRVFSN